MKLAEKNCAPNIDGIGPMSLDEARSFMSEIPDWELVDNGRRIERTVKFHDYATPLLLVERISGLAETQAHYPDLHLGWGYCTISFTTEDINGLHENDFIMAAKVDELCHEMRFASELRV